MKISTPPRPIVGEYQLVKTDHGDFWMSTADLVMRSYMNNTRVWEPTETRVFISMLSPNCQVLDVGANVGYFTVLAGRHCPSATIDAVEPHPETIKLLAMNLWHNQIDATIWPFALGADAGTASLETAVNNVGDTRTNSAEAETIARTVVAIQRGDDVFEGRSFDVMKLDVQGAELDVLIGLSRTIARSPRLRVLTECSLFDGQPSLDLNAVESMGFQIQLIDGPGPRDCTRPELRRVMDSLGPNDHISIILKRRS